MNSRMLAWLQLIRLPTVFTPMADIILGFVITQGLLYGPFSESLTDQVGWHHPSKFIGLLVASCCLYLSGMVFNDVFDRKQDAEERPGRPIPSGRISLFSAALFGTGLMLVGLASAVSVGWASLQVGLLLVVAILCYDSFFKKTPVGPVFMGSCRFLNVMLGASSNSSSLASLFVSPQLIVAAGLGIYIVGVTVFARTEAKVSNRWQLGFAQLILNVGIAVLAGMVLKYPLNPSDESPDLAAVWALLIVAFTVNRRAVRALQNPIPVNVQLGIKVMLLSYVMLDAAMVYWSLSRFNDSNYGTFHALATAGLIIPAMFLSRYIPMT